METTVSQSNGASYRRQHVLDVEAAHRPHGSECPDLHVWKESMEQRGTSQQGRAARHDIVHQHDVPRPRVQGIDDVNSSDVVIWGGPLGTSAL
jgi:hypothetical protein